jgi:hypothetical protein
LHAFRLLSLPGVVDWNGTDCALPAAVYEEQIRQNNPSWFNILAQIIINFPGQYVEAIKEAQV